MTVQDIIASNLFETLNAGNPDSEVTGLFCCDLLSVAMGRAPAGCCWVTVMGNMNTLAVASLTEAACIIFAEGTTIDSAVVDKAVDENITVLKTDMPIFDAALAVHLLLHPAP